MSRSHPRVHLKKVKLVTFHSAVNHGTVIQAYALQKTIQDMGFSVEIVDYKPPFMSAAYLGFGDAARTFVRKIIQYFIFYLFVKKHINLTKRTYRNYDDFIRYPIVADHLVCGSDQIWNLKILHGFDPVYLLDLPSISAKRTAYAVSMGETAIPDAEKEKFKDAISKIQDISAREQFTKDQIAICGRSEPVAVVLDPTLLPVKFSKIVPGKGPSQPYIALYFVVRSEEMRKAVLKLKKILKLPIVNISLSRFKEADKNELFLNPGQWLKRIQCATIVCTNSFHGTALSVKYHKPFYAVSARGDGTWSGNRIAELLFSLKLEHRLVDTSGELSDDAEELLKTIDFVKAEELIGERQNHSLDFLKRALCSVPKK